MGQLGDFLRIERVAAPERDPRARVRDHGEILQRLPAPEVGEQAARCMDCGVPFCHNGCPLGNRIPEWNDLVYRDRWREAIEQLLATNDFPEFTGRICPAPCESACVLAINDDPVMIKHIELAIVDHAFEQGWMTPRPPARRTGRSVAVVGSGPAGLAAASQLNRSGHDVTVYERDEAPGGLLRFGIPDCKLDKRIIDRRLDLLAAEGVRFRCGVEVGRSMPAEDLRAQHDALVIAIGSRVPRELAVPGRELRGVHLAMEYLYQRNREVAWQQRRGRRPRLAAEEEVSAAGKRVVIIGGGDTGMDCIANAHREVAASVTMLDTYETPVGAHARDLTPWPGHPKRLPTSYSLNEGGTREFCRAVTQLSGDGGRVAAVHGLAVGPPPDLAPLPGTDFALPADLVLIAIGFVHPEHDGPLTELSVDLDSHGNVRAPSYATAVEGVFAAGDARRGQSLIVWAIAEGRRCARVVDRYLAAPQPTAPAGGRVGASGTDQVGARHDMPQDRLGRT
jgi:glutamate synthase (NADPH) small chain